VPHIPRSPLRQGRLRDAAEAPATGEQVEVLAELAGCVVEEILSGSLEGPVDFDQDHDEWVVLLEGEAELAIGSTSVRLTPGDWLLIPAHVAHRLLRTDAGTRWLALHGSPAERGSTSSVRRARVR
jgi:cupin 2 domain-containing protein